MRAMRVSFICTVPPCVDFRMHAYNAESLSYLAGMLKAEPFKGKSTPCRLLRRRNSVRPEVHVRCCSVEESEVEQCEVVDQLVCSVPFRFAVKPVASNKPAFGEGVKRVRKLPGFRYSRESKYIMIRSRLEWKLLEGLLYLSFYQR